MIDLNWIRKQIIKNCFTALGKKKYTQVSDVDLLWRAAARSDSRIEPIPCGERQWNEDSSSAIVENARREGETILINQAEQIP